MRKKKEGREMVRESGRDDMNEKKGGGREWEEIERKREGGMDGEREQGGKERGREGREITRERDREKGKY